MNARRASELAVTVAVFSGVAIVMLAATTSLGDRLARLAGRDQPAPGETVPASVDPARFQIRQVEHATPAALRVDQLARGGELGPGVQAELDTMGARDDVAAPIEYYLRAESVATLRAAYAEAARRDPVAALPPEHELVFEPILPTADAPDRVPYVRSHVVARTPLITGHQVRTARVDADQLTSRAVVLAELDEDGTTIFADATARRIGTRLAMLFDGEVLSAPVISGAIRYGHVQITMGGVDMFADAEQAERIVAAMPHIETAPVTRPVASPWPVWLLAGVVVAAFAGSVTLHLSQPAVRR